MRKLTQAILADVPKILAVVPSPDGFDFFIDADDIPTDEESFADKHGLKWTDCFHGAENTVVVFTRAMPFEALARELMS